MQAAFDMDNYFFSHSTTNVGQMEIEPQEDLRLTFDSGVLGQEFYGYECSYALCFTGLGCAPTHPW